MKNDLEDKEFRNEDNGIENIDNNIEEILDKGLKERQGFFSFLKSAKNELGFKNIFIDKSELIFIGLIFIITITFFGLNFNMSIEGDIEFVYKFKVYNFTVAPIVYFVICSYSFISSRINGTYEIQATCKYNFYSITAIRMFIFSIISIITNTIIILVMFLAKGNFNLIETFIISATALLIFSVLYISILIHLKKYLFKYIAIIIWIIVAIIVFSNSNSYFSKLFLDLPLYIHLLITLICVIVYIKNLTKLMKVKRGEV